MRKLTGRNQEDCPIFNKNRPIQMSAFQHSQGGLCGCNLTVADNHSGNGLHGQVILLRHAVDYVRVNIHTS
jgi:hypothetical protein